MLKRAEAKRRFSNRVLRVSWDRLGLAMVLQQFRPTPLEHRLLHGQVALDKPVRLKTANAGSGSTTTLILTDGAGPFTAYHKPLDGIDAAQAAKYGHDRHSAIVNEAAAWFIAKNLGSPYRDMVPDMVVRSIWPTSAGTVGGYGTLTIEAPGQTKQDAQYRIPPNVIPPPSSTP